MKRWEDDEKKREMERKGDWMNLIKKEGKKI